MIHNSSSKATTFTEKLAALEFGRILTFSLLLLFPDELLL